MSGQNGRERAFRCFAMASHRSIGAVDDAIRPSRFAQSPTNRARASVDDDQSASLRSKLPCLDRAAGTAAPQRPESRTWRMERGLLAAVARVWLPGLQCLRPGRQPVSGQGKRGLRPRRNKWTTSCGAKGRRSSTSPSRSRGVPPARAVSQSPLMHRRQGRLEIHARRTNPTRYVRPDCQAPRRQYPGKFHRKGSDARR